MIHYHRRGPSIPYLGFAIPILTELRYAQFLQRCLENEHPDSDSKCGKFHNYQFFSVFFCFFVRADQQQLEGPGHPKALGGRTESSVGRLSLSGLTRSSWNAQAIPRLWEAKPSLRLDMSFCPG